MAKPAVIQLTRHARVDGCYRNSGEVMGVSEREADKLVEAGRAKRLDKPQAAAPAKPAADKAVASPTPKSQQREQLAKLAEQGEQARIRNALDAGDYNAMRSLLADLSDESIGRSTKDEVRAALEALLDT